MDKDRLIDEPKDQVTILVNGLKFKQSNNASGEMGEYLALFQSMVDKAADMVFLLGPMGRILYANEAACRALSYSREELQSMTVFDLNQKHHPDNWQEHVVELKKRGSMTFENVLKAKDGRLIPVEHSANYARLGDRDYNYSFIRDITERKWAEEELEKYRKRLEDLVGERTRKLEDLNARLQEDIAERKRTEEALRKSEERLNFAIEGANMGMWDTDRLTGESIWSDTTFRMLGYEPVPGGKATMEMWSRLIHPDDLPRTKLVIETAERVRSTYVHEFRINRADNGQTIWLQIFNRFLYDDAGRAVRSLGVVLDITQRKQAEEALRDKERQLAEGQVLTDTGSWEMNLATGEVLYSDNLLRLLQLSPGRHTYDELQALVHPEDRKRRYAAFKNCIDNGRPYDIDYRLVLPDNDLRHIHAIGRISHDFHGKPVKFLATIQDITGRKEAEEELKEAKARAELYLDLMGHDINNIHQVALGYLELAKNMPPGKEQTGFMDRSIEALYRSTRLISNVRKLEKLQNQALLTQDIDLCKVLLDVQHEFCGVPDKTVTINLNGHECCLVRANELLREAFYNLVSNAVKHTGNRANIVVSLDVINRNDRWHYRVTVEDDGRGVADELKDVIFHRKLRDAGTTKGMGLGLFLVKSLVDSYGGKVWVEDRVKGDHTKGARFALMLPAIEK